MAVHTSSRVKIFVAIATVVALFTLMRAAVTTDTAGAPLPVPELRTDLVKDQACTIFDRRGDHAFTIAQRQQFVSDLPRVAGIMRDVSAFVADIVSRAQDASGVSGAYGEWGTFQGKFLLALLMNARTTELEHGIFVADAFENLTNIMAAHAKRADLIKFGGNGCRRCFERQLLAWSPGALEHVSVYSGDTNELRSIIVKRATRRPFRLVSIDGEHSEAATLRDLCVVADAMQPGAVLAIDDVCGGWEAGPLTAWIKFAVEGACAGLVDAGFVQADRGATLEPFLLLGCKLWVTSAGTGHAQRYADAVASMRGLVSHYDLQRRETVWHALGDTSPNHNKPNQSWPVNQMFPRTLRTKAAMSLLMPAAAMHTTVAYNAAVKTFPPPKTFNDDTIFDAKVRRMHGDYLSRISCE